MKVDYEKRRKEILESRQENANRWKEADSAIGKRILERKLKQLDKILEQYSSIDVAETSSDTIIRQLIMNQTVERCIRDDINHLSGHKEISKKLDIALQEVDNAIEVRKVGANKHLR